MTVMSFGPPQDPTEIDSESGLNNANEKKCLPNPESNVQQIYQLPDGVSSAALSETNPNSYQFSNHPQEEVSIQVNNAEVMKQCQVKSKCCLIL